MNTHDYKVGDLVKIEEGAFGWDYSPDGEVVEIAEVFDDKSFICFYDFDYYHFAYDDIDHEATEKLGNLKEAGELHKEITSDDFISNVDHPSHYNQSGIECIEAIKATLGDNYQDYCKGNVIKYLWRYKYKNGLEDLKKAQWYLNSMVNALEE